MSVGSSEEEEEGEDQRNITKYFDYLNEDDFDGGSSQRRKKKKTKTLADKEGNIKDRKSTETNNKEYNVSKNEKNMHMNDSKKGRTSRKGDFEKDIRHIERHLSMKKTIRKKIMRDLQQAFVEDPKDLQQDPKGLTKEKKNIIDINNLTFCKNRLSKSEHNFLDMLKDDQPRERKGLRALIDFRKEKPSPGVAADTSSGNKDTNEGKHQAREAQLSEEGATKSPSSHEDEKSIDKIKDDDSGHGSPTREPRHNFNKRSKSKDDLLDESDGKDETLKKQSFWKRITGKGKSKR